MPGISCVLLLGSIENRFDPQVMENMIRKIELLGGVRQGRLHIASAIYFATQMKSHCKSFQVLTNTEYPASCFVLTDNQTCLMADLAFREFPGLLKSHYQRKKKLQIEGKGTKYKLGDFAINFITLFMGQSATVKGYLVEVSFPASNMIHLCGSLLRAFLTQVIPEVYSPPVCATATAGDQAAVAEHIFSQSFQCAMQAGSLDPARSQLGGGSQALLGFDLLATVASPASAEQSQTGGRQLDAARFAMTQFAEHINTVRRLSSWQPVTTTTTMGQAGGSLGLAPHPPSIEAGKAAAGPVEHYGYLPQQRLKVQSQH